MEHRELFSWQRSAQESVDESRGFGFAHPRGAAEPETNVLVALLTHRPRLAPPRCLARRSTRHFRGAGAGWAAGFGRVASIIAPLIVPLLIGYGTATLFVLFGASFVVACVLSLLLPELRGASLE